MFLLPRLSPLMLVGCAATDAWAPVGDSGAAFDQCVGQGSQGSTTTLGGETWTTEVRDSQLRKVGLVRWADSRRSRRSGQSTYAYDHDGLLTEQRSDWNGDGRFEYEETWERADDKVVMLLVVDDFTGLSQLSMRDTYTYLDGLLQRLESDEGLDGTIEYSESWTYESGRPTRMEARGFLEVQDVTTWFYPEAAPALDHTQSRDTDLDGRPDEVQVRRYDEQGHLVWWELTQGGIVRASVGYTWADDHLVLLQAVEDGVEVTITYVWDNGRLVLEERLLPQGSLALRQQFYDHRGLPTEYYSEYDELGDGTVESSSYQRWEWVCP